MLWIYTYMQESLCVSLFQVAKPRPCVPARVNPSLVYSYKLCVRSLGRIRFLSSYAIVVSVGVCHDELAAL